MFRAFFFILCLLFSLPGCFTQSNITEGNILSSKTEKPDSSAWDFGKVKEGQILKHDFFLKNESAKPLNIKDVNTSCGCTASEVKKRKLPPGESALIEVSFDSKGYSGPTEQFIYVHTDSLDNPVVRFIIKADVAKE